jgi:hypothetical protein
MVVGALGFGGLGAAGWVASRDPKEFVIGLVREALPGVQIDRPSALVFAQDFMNDFYWRFPRGRWAERLMAAAKIHGAETVRGVAGAGAFMQGGAFESAASETLRRALTRYLMNSNFFQLADPTSEPIVYTSPTSQACSNPFADLSPPTPADITRWR